ncbi:cytochrome P450 [Bacillus sp. 2205SS5-2]|uniref:cytochrome P450 n=1 Tax=Bacillus sp. 2205SS5-2 TaxID=3109031 RepID=UPI003005D2FD
MGMKVSGPRGSSMISGNLKEFQDNPLGFLDNIRINYQDVAKVRFLQYPIYILMKPDYIEEVLVTKAMSFHKNESFNELDPFTGEGLLTREGGFHLKQRRMMHPSVTKKHISLFGENTVEVTEKYLEEWDQNPLRIINEDLMNISLGVISKTLFSLSTFENKEISGNEMDTVLGLATKRIRALYHVPYSAPLKGNRNFQVVCSKLEKVVYTIMNYRREHPKQKYVDLLSIIVNACDNHSGNYLTNKLLRDELLKIFFDEHEATASTLSWVLYNLSKHTIAKEKVFEELEKIKVEQLSIEHIDQLSYLKAVILESLRLYPPVYLFGRRAFQNVEIGPFSVRKGEGIIISPYIIHKLSSSFEKAEMFCPERFLGDPINRIHPQAYFPFGNGSRKCLENPYALFEALLVLGTILRKFDVNLVEEVDMDPSITLRPKGKLKMLVKRR